MCPLYVGFFFLNSYTDKVCATLLVSHFDLAHLHMTFDKLVLHMIIDKLISFFFFQFPLIVPPSTPWNYDHITPTRDKKHVWQKPQKNTLLEAIWWSGDPSETCEDQWGGFKLYCKDRRSLKNGQKRNTCFDIKQVQDSQKYHFQMSPPQCLLAQEGQHKQLVICTLQHDFQPLY